MKEVKASITIKAPSHEVWKVLTDLENYHDWNPLFVQAKGTITDGETLSIKVRLPSLMLCGAPLSYSRSPNITKIEQNSYMEWTTLTSCVKGTHYFKLTTRNDNTTEFIQGERFEGWGTLFENMESTRRGIVSMNNALQLEISRRRAQDSKERSRSEIAKEGKQDSIEDDVIVQLGISDRPAIATAASSFDATSVTTCVDTDTNFGVNTTLRSNEEVKANIADSITVKTTANGITTATAISDSVSVTTSSPTEKSEKRISIIGVVSALFSSSKFIPFNIIQPSNSKEDLISSTVPEEQGESGETMMNEIAVDADDEEEGYKEEVEDLVAKQKREAKNAERIELNLDLGDLSFGDFEL